MRRTSILGIALAAATLAPSVARAVPIPISGTGSTGSSFTGSFDYSFTDDSHGTVDVILNDTTSSLIGGFLTGFAFNLPDGAAVTAVSLTTNANATNFVTLGGPTWDNSVNGADNGNFDIGAATGGSYEGGGMPSLGFGPGLTGTFSFALTGSGLSGLTAASFLSTLSVPPGDGGGLQSFVVRFRGLADDGSDKVPGTPGTPVPEPGTLMLIGAGLASLAARRRLRP